MADSIKIRITGDDSQYEKVLEGLGGKAQKAAGSVGNVMKGVLASQIVTRGFSMLTGGIRGAISAGMDFDAAMSTVAATSGASAEDIDKLTAKAKEMGATTQFSASQAADAMNYMAMAGWKAEEMTQGIDGIMHLAAASGEDLATTSDIVTDALTAFGMQASEAGHFADILAAASSNANTNVSMMGETFKYVAPLAGALGYDAEDLAAAIGLMANSGIKGSQAGTALRGLLTRMSKPTKESQAAMDALDISMTNADGTMKTFMEIIEDLRDRFSGLTETQRAEYAAMLAGQEGMSGMLAIVNASEADFEKLTGAITDCDGAAERMAETRMDNLAGDVKILQSAFEGLQLAVSESANGMARDVVQSVSDMLSAMNEAYAANGMDGMLNAFTAQFPKLLTKVIGVLEKLITEITRKLPDLLKSLTSALPNVLESLLEDLPGIAESLFAAVSAVAEQLIADLPRLVPMLVKGVLNLADAVIRGVASSGLSLVGSLVKMLTGTGTDVEDIWNSMVDDDIVLKMTSIEVEPPEPIDTTESVNVVQTAYQTIRNALNTPLLSPEQQAAVNGVINQGYQAVYNMLKGFGLDEATASEIAASVTTAYNQASLYLRTTSILTPEQLTAVQGIVDEGYDAVYEMLTGFGIDEATAGRIASAVTDGYNEAAAAIEGCEYLSADQKEKISTMIGDDYGEIYTALLGFGVPTGTAAQLAARVSLGYSAAAGAIEGCEYLTGAQKSVISDMIGGDYEEIYNQLLDFGVPSGTAAQLAARVSIGYGSASAAIEGCEYLTSAQKDKISGMIGGDYQTIYDQLIEFDVPDDTARTLAAKVSLGYARSAGAVYGCEYMTPAQKSTILGMIGGDYQAIYDKLIEFNVPEGTAAEIADKVSNVYSDIASGLVGLTLLDPTQQETILSMIGDTYDAIYNKLMEFGMDPTQAALTAHNIVTSFGIINNALRTPILSDDQTKVVTDAIDGGYEAVYNALIDCGFSETDAEATAKTITNAFNQIVGAFEGIDTEKFGVSKEDLAKIFINARGSKLALIQQLQEMKMNPQDIAQVTAIWDENVSSVTSEVPDMISAIYMALTDHDMSTDDQTLLDSMKDSALAADFQAVQDWLNTEIEKLDPNDPQYTQKITALHTQADQWKTELNSIDAEMTALITELAGQPTKVVQERLAEFEALERRANALAERLEQVTEQGKSQAELDYDRVTGGTTINEERIGTAQALSKAMRDKQMEELNAVYEELSGMATSVNAEQAVNDWFNQQVAAINAIYASRSGEILEGVMQAFSGLEGGEWITQMQSAYTLADLLTQRGGLLEEGQDTSEVEQRIKELYKEIFDVDPGEDLDRISGPFQEYFEQLWKDLDGIDTTQFASVIQGLIEQGVFDGVEGIEDMDFTEILDMLFSGTYKVEEAPEVEFNPNVKLDENGNVVVKAAEEIKQELSQTDPIEAEVPTEVTAGDVTVTSENGSSIGDAATAELKKQKMGVDVTADVTLTVNVTDSNATEVGTQVGIDLGNAVKDGVSSTSEAVKTSVTTVVGSAATASKSTAAYQSMQAGGAFVMSGFKAGLSSKMDEIRRMVREFCDSIAETMADAMEVSSPSRVTMRIGAFTGEGFEIGLRDSLQNAVRTAESVVSGMNLNTRVLPDFESAISGAVTSVYAAEGGRPIYLNVNGKTLARVTTREMQQAANNANRRVGLGVGK